VLTTGVAEDRLLGVSEMVYLPVRCGWIATANNPQLSDEMTCRTVRIKLDSGYEFPERRAGFRHPDLRRWARDCRGELVWSALVLARAWIIAGRPGPSARLLGGFEAWMHVIGGILEHAELGEILANADELRASGADTSMRELLQAIYSRLAEATFTTKDVLDPGVEHLPLGDDSDPVLAQRLGRRLHEIVDRPHGELVLRADVLDVAGVRRWQIRRLPS
jgi:hypothetical protein